MNTQAQLRLVNLHGQTMQVQVLQFQGGQEYQAYFDAISLPGGMYFLSLQVDGHISTKKIIVQHR